MDITETIHITTREEWKLWLEENHSTKKEIWMVYYRSHTGKPRISYNDAVEVAICYGWIDSTIKVMDEERTAQRYSPRRKNSILSEINKERVKRLILSGEMTEAGMKALEPHISSINENLHTDFTHKKFTIPKDIIAELKRDPEVWKNFEGFPAYYQIIRTSWINEARIRPDLFRKRLDYFIKMTKKNKMYGQFKQYLGYK